MYNNLENARAWYGQVRHGKSLLVVVSAAERPAQYVDFALWHSVLDDLEQRWFAPLTGLLRQRRIHRLTLQCEGRAWTVGPRDLLRFWRRPHALWPSV